MATISREELYKMVGQEVGVSKWFTVDQARINAFADVTEDHQFIHVDPERAKETPFGGTIAHGFLTLSLLSAMIYDGVPGMEGETMGVNYGFNRVRFLSPVPSGTRVRARFVLSEFDERKPGEVTTIMDVTVEIEGQEKPALVAEWIGRRYFEGGAA